MTESTHNAEKNSPVKSLIIPRLFLSTGSIIAILIVTELVLRIIGQPEFLEPHSQPVQFVFTNHQTAQGPLYLNQPGRITFRYDENPRGYFDALNEVHHDVSPSGFRGPAFTPKPEGTFRLIFLGDSYTFGEGVHNHDIYPEVTASLLRKKGRLAESCNLGVGGYNTSQEAEVLKLFGFGLNPDVVVLGYTLNDAEPPLFQIDQATGQPVRRAREAFIQAEGSPRKPPDSPLYNLHLAQAVWKTNRQRHLSKQTVAYYLSLHASDSAGRIESERALREIISECNKRGIPCIVVMLPLLYELSDDYPFRGIHQQVGEVVRQIGGRFIDLLPELIGLNARELIVHPTDQHPNEKVHAIAGSLLAEEIRRMTER